MKKDDAQMMAADAVMERIERYRPSSYADYLAARGRPPDAVRRTAEPGHPDIYGAYGPMLRDFLSTYENPDDLIKQKGIGVYDEMCQRDGTVRSSLWYRTAICLSRTWHIEAATQTPEDQREAERVKYSIETMNGSPKLTFWSIANGSWRRGVSIHEIEYRKVEEPGEWYRTFAWAGFNSVYPDPDTFAFVPTPFGRLTKMTQRQTNGKTVDLDPQKFVIYPNHFEDKQNWWGESDLRPVFQPYILKDFLLRFYGIYAEKYSGPIPFIKYPDGMPTGEIDKMLEVLTRLKFMNAIGVPMSCEGQLWSPSGTHQEILERGIQICDKAIARGLMLPDVISSEQTGQASFGIALVRYEGAYLSYIQLMGEILEEIFNEQAVKRLVLANNPNVYRFPHFRFDPLRTLDPNLIALMEFIIQYGGQLDYEQAKWFARQTGVPLPKDVGEEPTDDVDEVAEKMNATLVDMAEDWQSQADRKLRHLNCLDQVRRGLRTFVAGCRPDLDSGLRDHLATKETGKWAATIRPLAVKEGETGIVQFDTRTALHGFRKELMDYGGGH